MGPGASNVVARQSPVELGRHGQGRQCVGRPTGKASTPQCHRTVRAVLGVVVRFGGQEELLARGRDFQLTRHHDRPRSSVAFPGDPDQIVRRSPRR